MTQDAPAPLGFGMDAAILRRVLASNPAEGPSARARLRQLRHRWSAAMLRRALASLERIGMRGRVQCNICEWTGLEFRPLALGGWIQRNAVCPACGSVQRQRLVALALSKLPVGPSPVLWVAPERCLASAIATALGPTITVDIDMDGVDLHADVEALPVPDRRLGAVVSSDVLEHVVDDRHALVELRRVLRDGGMALLHVPVLWSETVEYGFAHPLEFGHRRGYGPDVVDRFEEAGFTVEPIQASRWSPPECRQLGLLDWDVAFVLRKA